MKNKKVTKSHTSCNQPILVLGWGVDGTGDVDAIAECFPYDQGLRCVRLPYADSRTVLKEVTAWLKGNTSATILYIGAHGAHNGLTPTGSRRSLDKIGYANSPIISPLISSMKRSRSPFGWVLATLNLPRPCGRPSNFYLYNS